MKMAQGRPSAARRSVPRARTSSVSLPTRPGRTHPEPAVPTIRRYRARVCGLGRTASSRVRTVRKRWNCRMAACSRPASKCSSINSRLAASSVGSVSASSAHSRPARSRSRYSRCTRSRRATAHSSYRSSGSRSPPNRVTTAAQVAGSPDDSARRAAASNSSRSIRTSADGQRVTVSPRRTTPSLHPIAWRASVAALCRLARAASGPRSGHSVSMICSVLSRRFGARVRSSTSWTARLLFQAVPSTGAPSIVTTKPPRTRSSICTPQVSHPGAVRCCRRASAQGGPFDWRVSKARWLRKGGSSGPPDAKPDPVQTGAVADARGGAPYARPNAPAEAV